MKLYMQPIKTICDPFGATASRVDDTCIYISAATGTNEEALYRLKQRFQDAGYNAFMYHTDTHPGALPNLGIFPD